MKYEFRYFHIISMLIKHINLPSAITFSETGRNAPCAGRIHIECLNKRL